MFNLCNFLYHFTYAQKYSKMIKLRNQLFRCQWHCVIVPRKLMGYLQKNRKFWKKFTANLFGESVTNMSNLLPTDPNIPYINVTEHCMIILRFDQDDFRFDRHHKLLLKNLYQFGLSRGNFEKFDQNFLFVFPRSSLDIILWFWK